MTTNIKNTTTPHSLEDRCDVKVRSGDCKHGTTSTDRGKYLCTTCGTLFNLDHEVHHEIFPHVSGDSDMLS